MKFQQKYIRKAVAQRQVQEAQEQKEQEGRELKGHEVQAVQAVEAGSSIESAERILVLDTIHGGSILVKELRLLGKDAFGLNPYRTTSPPAHDFDLVISPVHLSPALLEAVLSKLRGTASRKSFRTTMRFVKLFRRRASLKVCVR